MQLEREWTTRNVSENLVVNLYVKLYVRVKTVYLESKRKQPLWCICSCLVRCDVFFWAIWPCTLQGQIIQLSVRLVVEVEIEIILELVSDLHRKRLDCAGVNLNDCWTKNCSSLAAGKIRLPVNRIRTIFKFIIIGWSFWISNFYF